MALSALLSEVQPTNSADALPTLESAPEDDPVDLEEHLRMLVGYFEEAESTGREARANSERCRDYYSNIQLTAAELAAYRKRGQAPVYVNYIQRKVDTLCGIERKSRSDPKAFPRTPQDEQTATAATDALRFVADQNRLNALKSEVFGDILVEGTGGALVAVEEDRRGEIKVTTKRVPWDRLWWDPHSRDLNFADAAYKGIVIWMDEKVARRKWPDAEDAITTTLTSSAGETYDDRPKLTWCDSKRTRVRVVECHYLHDDEWWAATFTKGGFFEEPRVSPYLDKDGKSSCPLIMRSGFVNRENDRFGHCECLIPLQDEINKRRSKALHLLSARQTFGNKTAIVDVKATKTELAKPDGHVEINGGAEFGKDFGILPTGDMAQGQFLMLEQALTEMNATGANAAQQGKDERTQSGVALKTRIQAGAMELEPQTDGLREWTHEVYEAIWMRIRQYWTGVKWVRVTDDDRNIKFVGLNKPITVEDKLAQMPPEQRAMSMQQMQLQPGDPRLQQVIEIENDVSGLDVDIVLEEGPDLATLQSEQFEMLVNLASTPLAAGQIPFTAIIKASSLRNKDQLLDELEKSQAAQQQRQQQMQEEAHAAGKAEAEAGIAKTQSEVALNAAKTKATEADTLIQAINVMKPPDPQQPKAQQPRAKT